MINITLVKNSLHANIIQIPARECYVTHFHVNTYLMKAQQIHPLCLLFCVLDLSIFRHSLNLLIRFVTFLFVTTEFVMLILNINSGAYISGWAR